MSRIPNIQLMVFDCSTSPGHPACTEKSAPYANQSPRCTSFRGTYRPVAGTCWYHQFEEAMCTLEVGPLCAAQWDMESNCGKVYVGVIGGNIMGWMQRCWGRGGCIWICGNSGCRGQMQFTIPLLHTSTYLFSSLHDLLPITNNKEFWHFIIISLGMMSIIATCPHLNLAPNQVHHTFHDSRLPSISNTGFCVAHLLLLALVRIIGG